MSQPQYDLHKDPLDQVLAMDGAQELFLPIHGHVLLYPEEIAIIDHPSFQRLRRVRQLGLAHMVFPGATHTRFEHSTGAVYVAQLIVNHVNHNFRKYATETRRTEWRYEGIPLPVARFIRLSALLHDIGHLPFGHTLEDELHHLRAHDGSERLARVSDRKYSQYQLDTKAGLTTLPQAPSGGWSLRTLVNSLYEAFAKELAIPVDSFTLVTHIVCKSPKSADSAKPWREVEGEIEEKIDLGVCKDIVGNTICADFLDYLFRDWHHLGKSLYSDKRLYQYMEVRAHEPRQTRPNQGTKFVINVTGAPEKIRHDALTDILELLNARYKLAETVLFHRTKLALTGLLDRCLLETASLFEQLGLEENEHQNRLEELLLSSSDDGVLGVLKKMAEGGSTDNKGRLRDKLRSEREAIEGQVAPNKGLYDTDRSIGTTETQKQLVETLIERLESRQVYSLAYKLRMCDFNHPHTPENPQITKLLELYRSPRNRLDFLRALEVRCGLPQGALVMYCPHDAGMNAKIAKVNLFIDGDVSPFDKYEESQGNGGLTHGALKAQIGRFYELWSAYVFVERRIWDALKPPAQAHLKSTIKEFLFQRDATSDLQIVRSQIEVSIEAVRKELSLTAFRGGSGNPQTVEKLKGFVFPSGLTFDKKQ